MHVKLLQKSELVENAVPARVFKFDYFVVVVAAAVVVVFLLFRPKHIIRITRCLTQKM